MSVGDENVTVRSGCDSGRPVEGVRTVSCNSCLTEHQQDLSIRTELNDLVALAVFSLCVSHPHVAVLVDMHAVREHEHSRAKTDFTGLPDRSNLNIGARFEPAQGFREPLFARAAKNKSSVRSPHLSKTQMLPSRSTSTRIVFPTSFRRGISPNPLRCDTDCPARGLPTASR